MSIVAANRAAALIRARRSYGTRSFRVDPNLPSAHKCWAVHAAALPEILGAAVWAVNGAGDGA